MKGQPKMVGFDIKPRVGVDYKLTDVKEKGKNMIVLWDYDI
jgi:hypothetical protein